MKTTIEYLDAVKARSGIASDYALAPLLGITRAEVSRLRNGKSALGNNTALQVAILLQIDAAEVIASANGERARSPEERAVWQSIVQRLGSAGGLAGLVALGITMSVPSPANANQHPGITPEKATLKIM